MKKITSIVLIVATVAFTTSLFLLPAKTASAATITAASDKMSKQNVSANSTNVIKFRSISGVTATTNTIVITFPSDFNFTNSVITDLTMTEGASTGLENSETLGATAGASQWGAVFSGTSLVTLTLTAPTSGSTYVAAGDYVIVSYNTAGHEVNPSTAGSKSITISTTSGTSDTGTIAVPIISNSVVTLDATVAATLSFSNDNAALHFGTLSATAATWANNLTGSTTDVVGNTFTVSTNATGGYTLAYNAAPTLTSTVTGNPTIAAVTLTNSAAGTAGTAGGQFAMSGVYSGTIGNLTTAYQHATLSGNWKFNTAGETVITNTSPANAETLGMHYLANISNVTPAGVYATSVTWVVTANF